MSLTPLFMFAIQRRPDEPPEGGPTTLKDYAKAAK